MPLTITNFGTGLLNGINQGMQLKRRQDIEDNEIAQRNAEQDLRLSAAKRAESDTLALRQAGAQAAPQAGATVEGLSTPGNATQYSDANVAASDIRQNARMNEDSGAQQAASSPITLTPKIAVAGKLYDDQGTADKAAAAYNTPDAVEQRQAAVLRSQGKPAEAAAVDNITLTRQQGKLKAADEAWRRTLSTAMQAGHQGLAQLATQTESGPFAGKKVQAVPSADGKTVEYQVVGDDGKLTPTGLSFPNDENGVTMAAYRMDKAVTPEHRMEMMVKKNDSDSKAELRLSQAETGAARADAAQARSNAAQTAADAAADRARLAGQTGGPDSIRALAEQRKQATSAMTDATRGIDQKRKQINDLRRANPMGIKPGTPEYDELQGHQDDLQNYQAQHDAALRQLNDVGKKPDAAAPAPGAAPAAAPKAPMPAARPNVASVQGAPKGSAIGKQTPRGWEVLDPTGKLVGYVRN